MEIKRLEREEYAGRKFTARYQTRGYYDICASEKNSLNAKPFLRTMLYGRSLTTHISLLTASASRSGFCPA